MQGGFVRHYDGTSVAGGKDLSLSGSLAVCSEVTGLGRGSEPDLGFGSGCGRRTLVHEAAGEDLSNLSWFTASQELNKQ